MPTVYSDKIKNSNFDVVCKKCGSRDVMINGDLRSKVQFGGVSGKGSGSKGTISIECACGQKDVFTFG